MLVDVLSCEALSSQYPPQLGMDVAGHTVPHPLSNGAGVALASSDRQSLPLANSSSDGKHTPRKPSALQVSVTANAVNPQSPKLVKSPQSPNGFRSYSESAESSPQSTQSRMAPSMESPRSPRERLEDFLRIEDPHVDGDGRSNHAAKPNATVFAPSKTQSYSQLRNISSPLPDSIPHGNSSPPSPRSSAPPPPIGTQLRPGQAPRTSSIDSAISSISLATTHSPKGSLDSNSTTSSDVSGLIRAAGSAEGLISHLLREKQHSEGRTAQLWSLVEKQRKLLLGLNDDLHRAAKEKERYRKELEDLRNIVPTTNKAGVTLSGPSAEARSRSPAASESSADLPIQRQSQDDTGVDSLREDLITPRPSRAIRDEGIRTQPEATPTPLSTGDTIGPNQAPKVNSRHAHKHTSSSDLGVFNNSMASQDMPALQTQGLASSDGSPRTSPLSKPAMSPTSSFTAKRSQPSSTKSFGGPSLTLTESTPTGNDTDRMTPPRKAPPAPLDLDKPKREVIETSKEAIDEQSASEYEDDLNHSEAPVFDRGRKKTRAEDDHERRILHKQQEEERSRSKKQKTSKSRSESKKSRGHNQAVSEKKQALPLTPAVKSLAPEPTPALASSFLSQPASLASMLDPGPQHKGLEAVGQVRSSKAPLSPGLPLSPRPGDRPINAPTPRLPRDVNNTAVSPPLSPNPGFVGLPLSPRAPKQQIPFPPHTPISMGPPSPAPPRTESSNEITHAPQALLDFAKTNVSSEKVSLDSDSSQSVGLASTASKPTGIFRGFISEAYPGLLLPPNALPSIKVTVISSRLKPSRQSLVFKGDDEPVFTLGVSARFDAQELWIIEKPILSLHNLDQQLRQTSVLDVRLPERSLFSGHAPAKVDARRVALEKYFELLLDTQLDERAAVTLCQYLSTNASGPLSKESRNTAGPASPTAPKMSERTAKEGYLTKRGKNFGGWKARYFVLDEPMLRYYEGLNGTLLGTIKLHRAKIGKQTPPKTAGSGDESEGQFRHAFLIREPKKKDSNSYIDHVLCAESDVERDAWVAALMEYVSGPEPEVRSRPPMEKNESGSGKVVPHARKNPTRQNVASKDSPNSDEFDSLQAVPYEETRAAQPPHVHIIPDPRPEESPSPSTPGFGSQLSDRAPSASAKAISGPQNGVKISDAGAWGNKPMASPLPAQKEHKKRSLFGFHNKDAASFGTYESNGSNVALTQSQQQYQEQITNVKAAFGVPLAEAAEYCGPRGVEGVCLPAVVYRCLQYLEAKHAANEEGIFRMNGSNTLIKTLKNKFNNEGDFDLLATGQWYDINAVASLLKQYLRELPASIFSREMHLDFLQVLGM